MLGDSKRWQLTLRTLALIQEEDLPQQEAEDILLQTLGMLQAWQRTKQTG
jgi:hypothetical protein